MKCKQHPTYQAKYRPKADCATCEKMYTKKLVKALKAGLRA